MTGEAALTDRAVLPRLVANLRDLGGLRAGDRTVRPRRLLRCGSLVHLPPATLDALTALLGPGRYLDLRTDEEIERDGGAEPLVARGWQWCRLPLRDRTREAADDQEDRLGTLVPRYVAAADAVAAVVLTGENDGPDLVGCSLGKDRTGAVTALLLWRAGVDLAEIVADHVLSTAALAAGRHLLPARWRDPADALRPVTARGCAALLRHYERAGGGRCARLRAHLTGVSPDRGSA
jgi:protein-tyrosine phosphatase